MKILIIFLSLALFSCNSESYDIASDLKDAMAYGKMTELNSISPEKDKDLMVRLYQVPIFGENCFVETHGICRYQYYIAVSTFDEHPETNVFKLLNKGEITNTSWITENKIDYVEIEFSFNSYTNEALKNNSALNNKKYKILVKIDPKNLVEKLQ